MGMYGNQWARRARSILTVLFVVTLLAALLILLSQTGLFGTASKVLVKDWIDNAIDVYVSDSYYLRTTLAAVSAALAFMGAVFTLALNWHYNELQLPNRIKEAVEQDGQLERPVLKEALSYARLHPITESRVESSSTATTWMRFKRLFTASTIEHQTTQLAASLDETQAQFGAIKSAFEFTREKLITTYLVRGFQNATLDDTIALAEFTAATRADPGDWRALSAAAGCLRRMRRDNEELATLNVLLDVANRNSELLQAQTLRRQAEIRSGRQHPEELNEARKLLVTAQKLLGDRRAPNDEFTLEIGRNATLYCEIQIARSKTGNLSGRVTEAVEIMKGVKTQTLPDEMGGAAYGEQRAHTMKRSYEGQDLSDEDLSLEDK